MKWEELKQDDIIIDRLHGSQYIDKVVKKNGKLVLQCIAVKVEFYNEQTFTFNNGYWIKNPEDDEPIDYCIAHPENSTIIKKLTKQEKAQLLTQLI